MATHICDLQKHNIVSWRLSWADSTQDFYSKKIQENAADEQTEKGMKLQRAKREGRQRKTNKNSFGELYFVYVEIK